MDPAAPTIPNNIAAVLDTLRTLLTYGRHLLATVRRRAAAPTFNTIAAGFGTANLSTILAHLNRGILRATALENVLLARAATGRELDAIPRYPEPPPPAPADAQPEQPDTPPATREPIPRPSRPAGWNDPELFMPTLQDLERQARRRTVGRSIVDICLDLAVVPALCNVEFWNDLHEIMHHFGGSIGTLMRQKLRRKHALVQQQDRIIGSNWDWLRLKRDEIRQVLGFFIGEPPVDPFAPDAALATGPP
jgi:hypothetical protein